MNKFVNVFHCIVDVIVASIIIPIVYVLEVSYLTYIAIRYKVGFMDGFMNINEKYYRIIMNGFKIHGKRIFGV